jgi:hypothetical protein
MKNNDEGRRVREYTLKNHSRGLHDETPDEFTCEACETKRLAREAGFPNWEPFIPKYLRRKRVVA